MKTIAGALYTATLLVGIAAIAAFAATEPATSTVHERRGMIVFEARDGLYVVSAAGGVPKKIPGTRAGDGNPAWSPDSRRLSFERVTGDDPFENWDVWVMNADGSQPRRLTSTSPFDDHYAAWAPHGRTLVFMSLRDDPGFIDYAVYAIDVRTGQARRVTFLGDYPDWTRDGRIMFAYRGELLTVRPYGAERRPLPTDIAEDVLVARVSHDGEKIVYTHLGGLSTARVDGSGARPLTTNPEDYSTEDVRAAWSPDDNWVVYDRDRGNRSDVRLIRLGERESVQLTQTGTACCADWSSRSP